MYTALNRQAHQQANSNGNLAVSLLPSLAISKQTFIFVMALDLTLA